ncbi:MAG: DNA repair protein RecN [Actinobacteria bacterium]|nr:DNA repair protein RecN [Actinomycetota bacterium]
MLLELAVRDLGVIADLRLTFGPGMTALTGETGAGKTLVVEALELAVGGRADPVLVRPGADEAWVEARFELDGDEIVLARAIPAAGRSRGYIDGRMAPATALAETGARLLDLHGQHAHQSLLAPGPQRSSLDRYASIDRTPLRDARGALASIDAALAELGGDERARARELDLVRFQVNELDGAAITGPDEDESLQREEEVLADAAAHRQAAWAAADALAGDGGGADAVAAALTHVTGRAPFDSLQARLRGLVAELGDAAAEVRALAEGFEEDPERLAAVQARRAQLSDLRRKYGDSLADVLAFADDARRRLAELEGYEARAAQLDADRKHAVDAVAAAEATAGKARRKAAPKLAAAVQAHLQTLAMGGARFDVTVGDADPGDEVTFLLAANVGEPPLPLAKVASGGELARTMLAARLVLTRGPDTLVFDEVDAGVGGEAALAVGRALAALADPSAGHQVLVVTHLPQVAAFADHQVAISKAETGGRTVAGATALDDSGRVVELSRMLSGQPQSETARGHAEELLASAARERGR